jgi:hypothetical protein
MARDHAVVHIQVMSHQRGVNDCDPRNRLTYQRERPRPVQRPVPGKPSSHVTHRDEEPLQRVHLGHRISRILAIPRDPASRSAEPGVLAARYEHNAALLVVPAICHPAMWGVTSLPPAWPAERTHHAAVALWIACCRGTPGVRYLARCAVRGL